ncbi:MAG: hypothetical protein J6Y02_18950 [Pseudobutyrivibrio sp.]|nr:hypothetical protein [Pseudobutyrivibrio sp.]
MGMIKFNGASSKDFGVEVETFPNYVAPQKEYEAIHIPGRNGDLLIDSGTYSNVEKRYKVNMVKEPPATEVSGPIANFKSNVSLPLSELKTNIDPVQDLHGYSKPWIGGAGKNLFNYDAWKTVSINRGTAVFENNGVTLTATGNDAYTDFSNTSFPVDARVPITEGETITLSWQETTNTSGIVIIFPNGMTSGMVTVNNAAVKKATYTATSGITYVSFRFGVANSGDTIAYKNIQIEKGSQATSWEPYENICPITGSTSANIIRCGANLWDEEWELGALAWATGQPILSTDRIRSKNYCHIKGGNNYYIKVDTSKSGTPYLFYYDKNLNYISNTSDTTTINRVISIPDNAVFFKIVIIQTTVYNNNVSVNYPSSDTEYHAYKGSKYQSYFSGLANGTYGVVDLGTLNWINEDSVVSGLARVSDIQVVPLGAKYLQTPICTNFLGVLPKAYLDFNFGEIGFSNGTTRTFIRARSTEFIGKTNSEIKALMSGVYLIYELATPTTPTITQTVMSCCPYC